MFVWQAHKGKVRSLAFSPDGRLLATATGTGRFVTLWDPSTGQSVRKLDPGADERPVLSVAVAPSARLGAACTTDSVRVWDTERWEAVALLRAAPWSGGGYELAFGPGAAPRLAVGDAREVRLWEHAGRQTGAAARSPEVSF